MFNNKLYYEVLDLPMTASKQKILVTFQEKSKQYLPENVQNLDEDIRSLAATKLKELTEAYELLIDDARRSEYDDWIMKNSGLKISIEGWVIRDEPEPESPELTTEELVSVLEKTIEGTKTQICAIESSIRWNESSAEGFDVLLEGKKGNERYNIYIITVDALKAVDVENLIANTEHITSAFGTLLQKHFSLFLVICLDLEGEDKIRTDILQFNQDTVNKARTERVTKTNMVAMMDLKVGEFYFPYLKGFKPDFEHVKIPQGCSLV